MEPWESHNQEETNVVRIPQELVFRDFQRNKKNRGNLSSCKRWKLSLAKNGKTRETERFKRIDHRQARVLFSGGDAFVRTQEAENFDEEVKS